VSCVVGELPRGRTAVSGMDWWWGVFQGPPGGEGGFRFPFWSFKGTEKGTGARGGASGGKRYFVPEVLFERPSRAEVLFYLLGHGPSPVHGQRA